MRSTLLICCLMLLIFSGCQPTILFQEPQPANKSEANHFKKRFRGKYINPEDSVVLVISKKIISATWIGALPVSIEDLKDNPDYQVENQRLFGPELPKKGTKIIKINNDSFTIHFNTVDTLFHISKNQKLKYFKGYYFLNYKKMENNWTVRSLGFNEKGHLVLHNMKLPEDLEALREVTQVEKIKNKEGKVVDYLAKPSRRAFQRFIKDGGFRHEERFIKIE